MTKSTEHDTGEASESAEEQEHTLGGLAGEVVDAFEHLGDSKSARKAAKSAKKDEKKEAKVAKKAAKQAKKDCKKACKAGGSAVAATAAADTEAESRITPKKARNAVSVAKVVVPAAVPVIAPIAVRAAGSAREAYDRYRARKLGVDLDRLSEYSGHGAALHARIAGASDGLTALRNDQGAASTPSDGETTAQFVERGQATLRQLSASVRAAERMPTVRRKTAHRAVSGELDRLENELLKRIGPS